MVAQTVVRRHARPLRLLCLHGMYQDGATFASKTAHLRRGQDQLAEFIYVDGPFTVVPKIIAQRGTKPTGVSSSDQPESSQRRVRRSKKQDEFRSWWRPASGSLHVSDTQLDDDRAVLMAYLEDTLRELGDIDGVLGFSQGATLASWMCSHQAHDELRWSPRLAILIGSYLGPDQYSMSSGVVPDISSLHMFGSNDHVIPAARSQKVLDIFEQDKQRPNQVVTSIHSQGHVIPKSEEVLSLFHSFLREQNHLMTSASEVAATVPS